MATFFSRLAIAVLMVAGLALLLFGKRPSEFRLPLRHADGTIETGAGEVARLGPNGRVLVTMWEKWSGHEARAMQDLVDRFNLAQNRIFVNLVSISQVNQKMLIAAAGGDPPDICGLWAAQVGPFIANDAIEPLDELVADGTITPTTYKPYIWKICAPASGGGRLYGVSATPSTCALYWNKDLFRAAGLNPERPPRTIEEIDAMAGQLAVPGANGTYARLGFLPNEPGSWDYYWGIYWGNTLYDPATGRFHIDTPAQRAAFLWYQSYPLRFGVSSLGSFKEGFGQFNSPQNAFMSGKVAMVVQGPYFAKFIELNNPAMVGHYGVTFVPLPRSLGRPAGSITLGDLDVWVVPRGTRHKAAAMEVLRFFTRRENMERLCLAHYKPSPLMDVSPEFLDHNGNPYVRVFEQTMLAPTVVPMPSSPVWEQMQREINTANGNMWREPERYPVEPTLARLQKVADGYVDDYDHYIQMRRRLETRPPAPPFAEPAHAP